MTKTLLRAATGLLVCATLFSGGLTEVSAQNDSTATVTLGTGTLSNSGTVYPAPYGGYYWGARHQMLILASELPNFCVDSIHSLAFDIANLNTSTSMTDFTIKLGHTSSSAITTWQTGLTTVFYTASYTAALGVNTHVFNTGFEYNGVDNIVVEVCFNNSSFTQNASHYYSTTSFSSVVFYRADASGVCANTAITATSSNRPNMVLGVSGVVSTFDAGLTSLVSPTAQCSYGSEQIGVVITNGGSTTITSLPLAYKINNGTPVTGTYTGSLTSGNSDTFYFSTLANLTSLSSADIQVYHTSTSDFCNNNDTIDVALAAQLSGDYTIGGTTPDYNNFADAISDLNTIGICGPVTFHVRSGTYNEQVIIGAITGASAANNITFIADSNNTTAPVLTFGTNFVWQFNATSWITLDGLTLTATGSHNVIRFAGFCSNITVQNCVINGSTIASTSNLYASIFQSTALADYAHDVVIDNNTFNNGTYGTYLYGSTTAANFNRRISITNNDLNDIYYMAVYSSYADSNYIAGNDATIAPSTGTQYGYFTIGGFRSHFVGNRVIISTTGTSYGIYSTTSGLIGDRSLCANNMVGFSTNGTFSRGIYISASYWDMHYNSAATSTTNTSTVYATLYLSGTGNDMTNNAARQYGTGRAAYGFGTGFTHDYNVFNTGGATIANFTLTSNESSTNPGFNSSADLYISSFSATYDAGTSLAGITVDIDGNPRDASTPDIGASEYDLPENDAGVIAVTNPTSPVTVGSNNVQVSIYNFGILTLDTVQIGWRVNGVLQTPVQWTGSLAPGNTQTGVSLGTASFASGFTDIEAWTFSPNGETDENNSNDTIDVSVCTGLAGLYTVGAGASFDFNSIGEAVSALVNCGVSGAVEIDIDAASGPYNEQILITNITNASASNTITFFGNGASLQWNAQTTSPSVWRFDGAKHITIDSLNISSTNATTGWGVSFGNAADSNIVQNCSISVPQSTSTLSGPVVMSGSPTSIFTAGNSGNYNSIVDNHLFGGYHGVTLRGVSTTVAIQGNVISGNVIDGFFGYGTNSFFVSNSEFTGNDISRTNSLSTTTFYGLYFSSCNGGGINVYGNRIHDPYVTSVIAAGVFVISSDGTLGNPNLVTNNLIYDFTGGSTTAYGIYNSGSDHWIHEHNTITLDDAVSTAGTSFGFYQVITATGIELTNNIFNVTKVAPSQYGVYFATTTSTISSDYNVFWVDTTSTTSYVGFYSANQAELSNWQAVNSGAYDQNSTQESPVFANTSVGNLTPLSQAIDNLGTPVGVLFDIDNNPRSATTPDVGAIEFTGVPGDLAIVEGELSRESICYGTNDTVTISVQNVVGGTVNFGVDTLVIGWQVTGPVNSSGTIEVNTGTLTEGNTASFQGAGVNMSLPGTYTLNAYIALNGFNASPTNDTITNAASENVQPLLDVSPASVYYTNPFDSVNLVAVSPLLGGGEVLFSEIVQFKTTVGQPVGGWAAVNTWLTNDDHLELIGLANSSLEGYTVQTYNSNAVTPTYNFTFGTGAQFNSSGVAVLGWGGVAGNVNTTFNYYSAGISANVLNSTTVLGYVLRDPQGAVVDVVVNGTAFVWNAGSGVTSTDWSANMSANSGSTSGIRRTAATDNNSGADWVVSSATFPQDPGTYNPTVNTILPPPSGGITWTLGASTIGTDPVYVAGPYTQDDTLTYVATLDSICGIYVDSVTVIIDLTKADITASTNVTCNGAADGTASVTASGGDAPYTYAWSSGGNTANATGLAPGFNYVTVTDANGWSAVDSVMITEPSALVANGSSTNSTCGVANGSATATLTGGTTPYTYAWSTGGTTAAITGLTSAMYTATVSDANGCSDTLIVSVVDAGSPNISFNVDDVVCGGTSTGEVESVVTGGTSPYSYAWSNGATSGTIASIPAGTYTLTVTDAADCIVFQSTSVTENPTLIISGVADPVECNGGSTGGADVTVSGGITTYTYAWSNGATTEDIMNVAAGTYTVTATDAVGCTVVGSYVVTEPNALVASINTFANVTCTGFSNGSATASVAGGTSGYGYTWSNGALTATASGLVAGTYTVTVTDANGCTDTESITITQPASALSSSASTVTNVTCFGGTNGETSASGTGGTTPYSYLWSNASTNANATSLMAGTFTVTVTDANGCTSTSSATVTQPTLITAVDSIITPLCNGDSNGSVYTETGGGTGTLTYAWSNGATTEDITNVPAGSYTISVTDASSCEVAYTFVVGQPDVLSFSIDNVVNSTCELGSNGQIQVTTIGGTAPFAYNWSNGATTEDATGLEVGVYSMTITDTNGCSFVDSASVGFNLPKPVLELTGDDTVCFGEQAVIEATLGYSAYEWNTGYIFPVIFINESGSYAVTVTAANGCQNFDSLDVLIGDSISLAFNATNVNCEGGSDGAIEANVSGAFGNLVYAWSDGQTAGTATGLMAGTYSVTATDAIGCTVEGETSIDFNNVNPIVDLGNDTTVCYIPEFNSFNSITLDAGAGFATYVWSNGETTSSIGTDAPGVYSVVVEDDNGCFGTDSVTIDTANCLGVGSTIAGNSVSVYPNPARETISVRLTGESSGEVSIMVYSMEGRQLRNISDVKTGGVLETTIDLSDVARGVYMVRVQQGGQFSDTRLILQ